MCLMLAVSSALGQWRWNWFYGQSRPLADFDTLDAASRGAIGSFRLLWTTKSLAPIAIGAWTTIVVIGFDPFVQQLVNYRTKLIFRDEPETKVALAQRWSGGTEALDGPFNHTAILPTLDFKMQSSILFGLSENASAIRQKVPIACSSGNCKWTEYLSLGMCSNCVDLTDQISTRCRGTYYDYAFLTNGQTIGNLDVWDQSFAGFGPLEMTVKNTARPSESLAFKSTATLLQAVSILRANFSGDISQNWTSVPVTASECALYFCINLYHSEVNNGTLVEQWTEIPSTLDPASYQILPGEINKSTLVDNATNWAPNASADALFEWNNWFPRSDLQILLPQQRILGNNITTANISQSAVDSISVYLIDLFSNGTSDWFDQFGCTGGARASGSASNERRYAPPSMQALASTPLLNTTFFNLAASISANMRGTSDNQLKATGQLGTYETFIEHEALVSQVEKSAKEMSVTLGNKLKLERADDVAMSPGTDNQNREADPSPRIDFQTRHSSLFTPQEMQTLTTTGLLHQHDA
ncbi:hypothetical protein MMC22_005799 [Lobaria immixta]|nr:hypothetical protein [Lobaria immixta]